VHGDGQDGQGWDLDIHGKRPRFTHSVSPGKCPLFDRPHRSKDKTAGRVDWSNRGRPHTCRYFGVRGGDLPGFLLIGSLARWPEFSSTSSTAIMSIRSQASHVAGRARCPSSEDWNIPGPHARF